MDARDQVLFILQVVLALGPIAVYFLALGLVNSQARPFLISARRDFVLLASAFVPLVLVPAFGLVATGHGWLALVVVAGVVALFRAMLPARHTAWVIYNVGVGQFHRLLGRACRRQGWQLRTEGDVLCIDPVGLQLTRHGITWLRNVSLEFHGAGRHSAHARQLVEALNDELGCESMLPSPTGASLVVIGASLLGLPMWYLFTHMDQIVDVVRQILFA
ncbi:MAG TPA: hypothetical protein PKG54_07725 [Phycisphaerae bacterium]|nr:hypothetical protein [Phycisphaerae bacterium]HOB74399.1 hypothetical protein [Phycisphaerae bacterium]HOJ54482.1 hypothetical protein [Phycisphaerae bacterium]HOL26511.1 hypothetical protein [Phycisphaerae bacterium]HPP20910.1 hypothetical protein [Phycisphaerae bacterium]